MATVILENIYKSFPRRGQTQAAPKTEASLAAVPAATGASAAVEQSVETEPTAHTPATATVLRRINLKVQDGEFMVLVGPSGCGKSTLLRLLAGLEPLTAGNIWIGDALVNDLPPKARDIAMVFQSYALYPHLTVYNNLAFGLRRTFAEPKASLDIDSTKTAPDQSGKNGVAKIITQRIRRELRSQLSDLAVATTRRLPPGLRYWSAKEKYVHQQVQTVAKMLQIEPLLDRLPRQLSGGQKQRVALGRAMARNPQVFLMDEPLSNLDAKLRGETRSQIVNLQRQLGITTIYVTHDQTEAMTMGDRIAVMNAGQIQQVDRPLELYNRPANRFVAEFIGSPPMNFLPVEVKAPLLITHADFRLTLPETWENVLQSYDGRTVTLGIRPEHLSLSVPAPKNLRGVVKHVEALGSETYLTVDITDQTLQARIDADHTVRIGEEVWLAIAPNRIHLFDPKTDEALFND